MKKVYKSIIGSTAAIVILIIAEGREVTTDGVMDYAIYRGYAHNK